MFVHKIIHPIIILYEWGVVVVGRCRHNKLGRQVVLVTLVSQVAAAADDGLSKRELQ